MIAYDRVGDEALLGQLGEGQRLAGREWMGDGQRDEARLLGDDLDLELGLPGVQPGERDVDLAAEDRVDAPEWQLVHGNGVGRMTLTERPQRVREQVAAAEP